MRAKGLWALSLPKQCAVCSLDGLCMPTCLSMFALSSQVSAAVLCTYLCTFIAQCWRDLVLATVKQPSLPANMLKALLVGKMPWLQAVAGPLGGAGAAVDAGTRCS